MTKESTIQYENPELCQKCKGRCCKQCGCHFSPDDFAKLTEEFLRNEILKGYIAIDLVSKYDEGVEKDTWILRIRNRNEGIVQRNFRGGQCILQMEEGCKLSFKKRPKGGRELIPSEDYNCYTRYDIGPCCEDWWPYQKILEKLVEEFEGKDIPCSI